MNMSDDKYAWQKGVFGKWRDNGFKGCVKATVGSGKTRAGMGVVKTYLHYFPYDRVWIIANSKEVLNQWKAESVTMGVDGLEFFTYMGAVSKLNKLTREGKEKQFPQVMILDECHCINAPTWGRVMDFGIERYLGLSGTPNGSEKRLGGVIVTVGWNESNTVDTEVYAVTFKPTAQEMETYKKKSETIAKYRGKHPNSNYKNDLRLQMLYNGRRAIVNKFESRYGHTLRLIENYKGQKIMVFCQYHLQAEILSQMLDNRRLQHTIHISGKEGLDMFISGEVDICISCKKLTTGFNYPPASIAIIMATATSPLTATQTLGRVIRPDPDNPDKKAKVIFLLADGTNDMALLDKGIYLKEKTHMVPIEQFVGDKDD